MKGWISLVILVFAFLLYQEYRQYSSCQVQTIDLHTGDIVLTRNANTINPTTLFTRSRYSHVGIVIDGAEQLIAHKQRNTIGITFSTLSELKNSGNYILISILPIQKPLDSNLLKKHVETYKDVLFESNWWEILMAAVDVMKRNRKNVNQLFCSEFIAQLLQDTNYLSSEIPSNEYIPQDFLSIPGYASSEIVVYQSNCYCV